MSDVLILCSQMRVSGDAESSKSENVILLEPFIRMAKNQKSYSVSTDCTHSICERLHLADKAESTNACEICVRVDEYYQNQNDYVSKSNVIQFRKNPSTRCSDLARISEFMNDEKPL